MRIARLSIVLLTTVNACVQAPSPPPRPAPTVVRPAPPPVSAPVTDWSDREHAPGTWTYRSDDRGSVAMYGQVGSDALFTFRCERQATRIFASRAGATAGRMTLRSTSGVKAYDALPTGGVPSYVAAEIAPRDPQLDAMAFSRGRILVGLDGAADLILPIWPEFARVVEDCRP